MFDWQRFSRLALAHWIEYRKAYAWFIGIGIMIHFVLLLIIFIDNSGYRTLSTDGQEGTYYAGLFLTAPIFAARYFQLMSRRESALIILMRPASVFEKWLLAFLIIALLYPVLYSLAFYVCNIPAWLIAKSHAQQILAANITTNSYAEKYDPANYELFFVLKHIRNGSDLIAIALSLTILQSFAVLGSLYFKAMPFIKTMVLAFFILLVSIFISTFFGGSVDTVFDYWSTQRTMSPLQAFMYPFMWTSLPMLLWLSCYFALKEREVV
jgi:hypothetical protein